jgi:hypothetical protein
LLLPNISFANWNVLLQVSHWIVLIDEMHFYYKMWKYLLSFMSPLLLFDGV